MHCWKHAHFSKNDLTLEFENQKFGVFTFSMITLDWLIRFGDKKNDLESSEKFLQD